MQTRKWLMFLCSDSLGEPLIPDMPCAPGCHSHQRLHGPYSPSNSANWNRSTQDLLAIHMAQWSRTECYKCSEISPSHIWRSLKRFLFNVIARRTQNNDWYNKSDTNDLAWLGKSIWKTTLAKSKFKVTQYPRLAIGCHVDIAEGHYYSCDNGVSSQKII